MCGGWFEQFAHGKLITLFSATNYYGTANNTGAILVIGRGLVVVPKLIHPLPLHGHSPETSPERAIDETWIQELNTQWPPIPTRKVLSSLVGVNYRTIIVHKYLA